ncbi:MAG TPA: fused MFS/spermidine synthase [Acidimicrobiales bacterium]|nr:fused MFS/spermidine synthase [Acidimicrobiales bacterium]
MTGASPPLSRSTSGLLLALFFASGFAALVYQVLWARQLGLLLGSTAQSAALTIAIFFTGIAAGGWFWGQRSTAGSSSLRLFGLVEVGVALTALGHFVVIDAYHAVQPALFRLMDAPALDTVTKAVIAASLLLPPSFLMGGTLPLMGQHLVRRPSRLARTGTVLYGVNTAGSATGALAAGFVLPLALGLRGTYLLAVGVDLVVGVVAVSLARREQTIPLPQPERLPARETPPPVGGVVPRVVWVVALTSGFATLAVEVVWTRLFAQVLQNSAYTYALVLTTFLVALALGAALANLLSRIRRPGPEVLLGCLLLVAGYLVALSPWLLHQMTGGLGELGGGLGWLPYLTAVAGLIVPVMLLPGIALGAVLPYLLRSLQDAGRKPGDAIGRLVAVNTVGAVLGSLVAGFVLLPLVGSSRTLLGLAAIYPALVVALALSRASPRRVGVAAAAAAVALALLLAPLDGLDRVHLRRDDERVVEVREGARATVAVVARGVDRTMRVDNHYTLGGSAGLDGERNQAVLPLLLHPDPRSVFFLGMGTGITAGAALAFPVERVVVCELLRDVIALGEEHFGPWTNGLYDDPRVVIHAEDGRRCLRRSTERFDLVISDLFTPWRAGTGSLYTREHFETVRTRLAPGGIFVQWVPLYQVSERELGVIANTMDAAFDEVVLWRGDLFAERSIVGLVGHVDSRPVAPATAARNARHLVDDDVSEAALEALLLRLYAGNVTASGIFAGHALNTDDRPVIEYLAPRTQREAQAGRTSLLVGPARERLYADLRDAVDPARDPYLSRLDTVQLGYVEAGWHRSRSAFLSNVGDAAAAGHEHHFVRLSPPGSTAVVSPAARLLPSPDPG